jgi:hypothetical protein
LLPADPAYLIALLAPGEFPLPNKGYDGLSGLDSDPKDTKPKGFAP